MSARGASRPRARKRPAGEYHHGNLREALLDSTEAIIEASGVEAVSLRDVARRLDVTPAAPYHHFADRDALLGAVATRAFRALVDAVREALGGDATASPGARMAAGARTYLGFATSHPGRYRAMFLPAFRARERFVPLHAVGEEAFALLASLVGDASASRDFGRVASAAVSCWSTLHGFACLVNDGVIDSKPGLPGRDTLADGIVETVCDLAARA